MSFLFESENFEMITRDYVRSLEKIAQENQNAVFKSVVNKLVDRLNADMNAPVFSDGSSLNLRPVKLSDLTFDGLTNYAIQNEMTTREFGRVAYSPEQFQSLSPEEQRKLNQVGQNFINPQAMEVFVRSLQTGQDNPLIKSQLAVLVDEVNSKMGTKLDRRPQDQKAEQQGTAQFSDEQLIDRVHKVFEQDHEAREGPNVLKAKDLKDRASFNSWLMSLPEAAFIEKGQTEWKRFSADPQKGFPIIVEALKKRATRLSGSATENWTALMNFYRHQLDLLSGGSPSSSAGNTPSGQSGEAQSDEVNVNHVAATLPFNTRTIDLNQIEDFLNSITKFVSFISTKGDQAAKMRASTLSQLVQKVKSEINELSPKTSTRVFSLNQQARDFASSLTTRADFIPALNLLHRIVNDTANILRSFNSFYGDKLNESASDQIKQQALNQNSVLTFANRFLQNMQSRVGEVMRIQ